MASAVAKSSTRSASWPVMHSDEELARILQIQEEKEYQDHLTAKEVQCKSDHKLARFLSQYDDVTDMDKLPEAGPVTRQRAARRSALNSNSALDSTGSQNTTVISMTDSDTDFSDCFDDSIFDDLSSALQVAREESDRLAEQQDAADALARDDEIAEAVQNDELLNRMGETEFELSGSVGEPGNSSSCPIVVSPASAVNSVSICSDPSDHGQELMEFSGVDASFEGDWTSDSDTFPAEIPTANNSLLTSVNIALNVVGSAVNWVSELFSGVPSQPQSITNRVAAYSTGHAEEDEEEEEEEVCEEDDGWDDEDSDDFDEDDNDDDNDDDDAAFDVIDSDMDDSDDDNIEQVVGFGNNVVVRGRGLVQEEIDVLPTRTFQSRPPTAPTGTAADAGSDEHQCQNECQVCLSCFADGEVLRTLPCCHQFHSECIDVWLQRNAICPVCRVRIRDEIGCR